MINKVFFDLIQVAIGTKRCLSHSPSADEWGTLYALAKKQSLVGVCFAGVQRLQKQEQCPPETLYLQWMGMAAKIQQRNETVNKQCVELQARLKADGFRCCILKGQGVAQLYSDELRMLRQSGDIDVWCDADAESVMRYVNGIAPTEEINELHAHLHIYKDTDVEVHFVPSRLANRNANRRLMCWFSEQKSEQMLHFVTIGDDTVCVPTVEFNVVYLLLHIYRHLFSEEVGLRQLMDYYFVLEAFVNETKHNADYYCKRACILQTVEMVDLARFASGITWIMHHLYGMSMIDALWTPNQKEGEFLLNEIMLTGNFGHEDDRFRLNSNDSHISRYWQMISSKWRFVAHYPQEVFWQPIDTFLRFFEIRMLRRKMRLLNK